MGFIKSLILLIVLFLGLCMLVVQIIATINIYTKSYQPKRIIPILLLFSVLFVIAGGLAFQKTYALFQDTSFADTTPTNTTKTPEPVKSNVQF
jgi:glucan phosphoethanolaminetransferase (alkaline phosphatase superfamily)